MIRTIFTIVFITSCAFVFCQESSQESANSQSVKQADRKLRHGRRPIYHHQLKGQKSDLQENVQNAQDIIIEQSTQQQFSHNIKKTQNLRQEFSENKKIQLDYVGLTRNITGSWIPMNNPKILIIFDRATNGEGKFSLNGCNIHTCQYTIDGNKFSTNGLCLSTQRGCQVDNDPEYLTNLKNANFVFGIGKDKLVFFDNNKLKLLVLLRKNSN